MPRYERIESCCAWNLTRDIRKRLGVNFPKNGATISDLTFNECGGICLSRVSLKSIKDAKQREVIHYMLCGINVTAIAKDV